MMSVQGMNSLTKGCVLTPKPIFMMSVQGMNSLTKGCVLTPRPIFMMSVEGINIDYCVFLEIIRSYWSCMNSSS